ncbi:MAG: ABC transporter permease [Candidatus Aenigmarchaeota archaeon]|nr:ABC transporter permease [Candidatus Aenigmarchaeota archaeon]MDW8160036.1 ABC transporter permease [Candidatus Aenigmarchaeota archaeon]
MKIKDIVRLALNNISHRKLRSWLTILGIVIGISAIISLNSIGEGMRNRINQQLSGLGPDIITITPGYTRAAQYQFERYMQIVRGFRGEERPLTENDLRIIKSIPGVSYVNGIISGRSNVTFKGQSISLNIQGVDATVWKHIEITKLEKGRYLTSNDRGVVVLGYRVAYKIFKNEIQVGDVITINGQSFRVVGILQTSGILGVITDSTIFITKDDAKKILNIHNNQISSIVVKVSDIEKVDEIALEIEKRLRIHRKVSEKNQDFTVTSTQSIREQVMSIADTTTFFLTIIAAVSLLVGGIGIANTMFTSVMERTKLIGTLKALGMSNKKIMTLFLIESVIISLIGGLIGIGFGIILSDLIGRLIAEFYQTVELERNQSIQLIVTPQILAISLILAVCVGVLAGLIPARRAAKLEPVEALKYE